MNTIIWNHFFKQCRTESDPSISGDDLSEQSIWMKNSLMKVQVHIMVYRKKYVNLHLKFWLSLVIITIWTWCHPHHMLTCIHFNQNKKVLSPLVMGYICAWKKRRHTEKQKNSQKIKGRKQIERMDEKGCDERKRNRGFF